MRNIFVISFTILLGIAGCTECSRHISSSESIECQRLRILWEHAGEENPQIIIPETETDSGDEITWQELGDAVFSAAGCCFCKSHPLANEWKEYKRLECIWANLERENIQKIAFYQILGPEFVPPKDWHPWAEITELEKIKEILGLLCKAMKKERNKFTNEDAIVGGIARMQIITDKHRFIIPISGYGKAIRGVGWTSYELRKKLIEWGFPNPE